MKVIHRHHENYENILNTINTSNQKISIILPARNEYRTIGKYLPKFAKLMELGHIHEIILADSSDDGKTINEFLLSAMQTEPFATIMKQKIIENEPLPIKAVNVFDPRFQKLFGDKKPILGNSPGKGRAMYLGMAVATGDNYIFLDSDFFNIEPRFLNGLIGPLQNDEVKLVKATFELEDEWQTAIDECKKVKGELSTFKNLTKSTNSRNLARPLMKLISNKYNTHPSIELFEGPLSGGYGAKASIWKHIKIPTKYGVEVYTLMEFIKQFPKDTIAVDVNLGIVDQISADEEGQKEMGRNIVGAFLRNIRDKHNEMFEKISKSPDTFILEYCKEAYASSVHVNDPEKINFYAELLKERILNPEILNKTFILPSLDKNDFFINHQEELNIFARNITIERLNILNEETAIKSEETEIKSEKIIEEISINA